MLLKYTFVGNKTNDFWSAIDPDIIYILDNFVSQLSKSIPLDINDAPFFCIFFTVKITLSSKENTAFPA